ncbi:MAG TPA: bifunctional DNA-formamidopyrimidine glycosylase/DNA-(apurinic or apyrimidinic site) lyase [Hyphomicrobiaceae bacterium]|nr:bifunctional DNA-formamidopyrimidine glycosylase/DNA-(apurinic or apyrimidinic site) lyase [Hyphomicrobiaceae bacterium]
MPELPEVETVRAGLEPVLTGRAFVRVEQRRPDLRFPLPERFAERLTGRRVLGLDRRAKYILVRLDGDEVLAMHLGMTGRLIVSNGGNGNGETGGQVGGLTLGQYQYQHNKDAKHDHLVFTMSGGAVVTYNDARRFGYMTLIPERELEQDAFFAGLGVEPLSDDLSGAYLAQRAHGKKVDLKAFLMDQRIVAGLGNIYVCEALFRARLDPWKPASRLATKTGKATPAAERLAAEIKAVLTDAIRAGGSTLRDYKRADGTAGLFQNEFSVYGREGEPCLTPGCVGTVRRKVQGGRSTFYCAACQR